LVQSAVTFKTNYHGNSLVKEFNGIESTREAIEKVKNCQDIIARNGMKVTMFITGSQVQIARLNGGEQVQKHGVGQISCIVYDTDNMCMFGYITSETEQLTRHTHVFSAENRETASEILTAICNGYKETVGRTVEREGRRGRAAKRASQSESDKGPAGQAGREQRHSRSDQLVTRMRNFFQGGDQSGSGRSYSISSKAGGSAARREAKRKRGGSMDNLIDSIDTADSSPITEDTKKKCSSIKNLSCLVPSLSMSREGGRDGKEIKITSV